MSFDGHHDGLMPPRRRPMLYSTEFSFPCYFAYAGLDFIPIRCAVAERLRANFTPPDLIRELSEQNACNRTLLSASIRASRLFRLRISDL